LEVEGILSQAVDPKEAEMNPIVTDKYTLFQGDCLEYMKTMPDSPWMR
jgi:hypothetical protein